MLAIQTLLRKSIDYAGLFPPAQLDMETAVKNYAGYRTGDDAWALGRFIVPAGRLSEFEPSAAPYFSLASETGPWQLAALLGPDLDSDLEQVAACNHRNAGLARVDTLEVKASSVAAIEDVLLKVPRLLHTYIEIQLQADPAPLVASVAAHRGRAKARTGGVTRDAFPRAAELVRFMSACIRAGVPFKTTAGLHHAIRGEYRLTYSSNSPSGFMFGFLNVFLAAAFLLAGMSEVEGQQILEEGSLRAFEFDTRSVTWRGNSLSLSDLQHARHSGLISFGSCSFTEPLAELRALQLIPSGVQRA